MHNSILKNLRTGEVGGVYRDWWLILLVLRIEYDFGITSNSFMNFVIIPMYSTLGYLSKLLVALSLTCHVGSRGYDLVTSQVNGLITFKWQ